MISAVEALERLREGNRRFVAGRLGTGEKDRQALVHHAVRANVRASANHLRHGSQVLEELIETDELLVVGAECSLETGEVDFFDGVPGRA